MAAGKTYKIHLGVNKGVSSKVSKTTLKRLIKNEFQHLLRGGASATELKQFMSISNKLYNADKWNKQMERQYMAILGGESWLFGGAGAPTVSKTKAGTQGLGYMYKSATISKSETKSGHVANNIAKLGLSKAWATRYFNKGFISKTLKDAIHDAATNFSDGNIGADLFNKLLQSPRINNISRNYTGFYNNWCKWVSDENYKAWLARELEFIGWGANEIDILLDYLQNQICRSRYGKYDKALPKDKEHLNILDNIKIGAK